MALAMGLNTNSTPYRTSSEIRQQAFPPYHHERKPGIQWKDKPIHPIEERSVVAYNVQG
jgi:hypothetical protein